MYSIDKDIAAQHFTSYNYGPPSGPKLVGHPKTHLMCKTCIKNVEDDHFDSKGWKKRSSVICLLRASVNLTELNFYLNALKANEALNFNQFYFASKWNFNIMFFINWIIQVKNK